MHSIGYERSLVRLKGSVFGVVGLLRPGLLLVSQDRATFGRDIVT